MDGSLVGTLRPKIIFNQSVPCGEFKFITAIEQYSRSEVDRGGGTSYKLYCCAVFLVSAAWSVHKLIDQRPRKLNREIQFLFG